MFPNVSRVLNNFAGTVKFQVVVKTTVDYDTVETLKTAKSFRGVLEPIHSQKLLVKPEGQRTWKWWTLWTPMALALDGIVKDEKEKIYRVMSVYDWSKGGYYEYELTETVNP